jgi:hypothetical protein
MDHFVCDPATGLSASGPGIARWHRSQLRRKRSCDDPIHARQTYHQDYHPDRTFHGLFLLECGSPGSGYPHGEELYRVSQGVKVSGG